MSRHADDLTGRRFGKLKVLRRGSNVNGGTAWACLCECGNTRTIRSCSLVKGATMSCGCLRRSASQERMRKRALSRAGQKRYRPIDEVLAEVFRDPLALLEKYAKAALAETA